MNERFGPRVRAALERAGFRPSKRLGQNFLLDENMARAIVRDAGIEAGARVLEVGPGCGALTRQLLEAGAHVVAVEIDRRLVEIVRGELGDEPRLELVHADALAGKHELGPALRERLPPEGPWHLVANLPYSVGTPLIALLAREPNPPRSLTALLQKELAQRLAAEPGTRAWGAVTARVRRRYTAELVRDVGPGLFWPRPKVASAVVRLELLGDSPAEADDYDALVAGLFRMRRKTLGRLAAGLVGAEQAPAWLAAAGIDPSRRPEELDPAALGRLAAHPLWRDRGPG